MPASAPFSIPTLFPNRCDDACCYFRLRLLRSLLLLLAVAQRFVHLTAHPQAVQQHRQSPCHRNHRSLLGVLPSSFADPLSSPPQIAVLTVRSQHVVRTIHQRLAQILVPCLGDPQLGLACPSILLLRPHPQKTSHRPTLLKPLRVADRQHERQCCMHPYPVNLLQQPVLPIPLLCDMFFHFVVVPALLVEMIDGLQQRRHRSPYRCWHLLRHLRRQRFRRALLQPLPQPFTHPAHRIHQF